MATGKKNRGEGKTSEKPAEGVRGRVMLPKAYLSEPLLVLRNKKKKPY